MQGHGTRLSCAGWAVISGVAWRRVDPCWHRALRSAPVPAAAVAPQHKPAVFRAHRPTSRPRVPPKRLVAAAGLAQRALRGRRLKRTATWRPSPALRPHTSSVPCPAVVAMGRRHLLGASEWRGCWSRPGRQHRATHPARRLARRMPSRRTYPSSTRTNPRWVARVCVCLWLSVAVCGCGCQCTAHV